MRLDVFLLNQLTDQMAEPAVIVCMQEIFLDVERRPARRTDEVQCLEKCRWWDITITQGSHRGQAIQLVIAQLCFILPGQIGQIGNPVIRVYTGAIT